MRTPAAVAALLLIGCATYAPAAPWWTTLDSRVLAELRPQDCTQDIPKPWQVEGDLRLVADGTTVKPPDSPEPLEARMNDSPRAPAVLEATRNTVRLMAGGPDWQRYAVTAEVRFSPAGGSIALAAACDGYVPLDLTARCNRERLTLDKDPATTAFAPETLPAGEQFIAVGGVPFYWTAAPLRSNCLDLGAAALRGGQEYIRTDATSGDLRRLLLRVPKRQYRALALLAAADPRDKTLNVLNVRMLKPWRGLVLDACAAIPRWNAETVASVPNLPGPDLPLGLPAAVPLSIEVLQAKTRTPARLWLVHVPLDPGAFQDFLGSSDEWYLELDLTNPPLTPGYPALVQQPSGVRILAASLVESPVEMSVTSGEPGHVFVQPQQPAFTLRLTNRTAAARRGNVEVLTTDFYGGRRTQTFPYEVPAGGETPCAAPLPADVLGVHALDVRLRDAQGTLLIRRQTTFATLPPDTRQADKDSPFGMWVFAEGHFGAGHAAAGSLLQKIGIRWSLTEDDADFVARYHVYPAYEGLFRAKTPAAAVANLKAKPHLLHLAVFQESALGAGHYHYFPPELLEKPAPRPLEPEEEPVFEQAWQRAIAYSEAIRKECPERRLVFGNGYPQFIATFLSRGYPKKYLDGLSLDFMGDQMNLFFYLRKVARHYGYGDVPLHITEGFYCGTGCGFYARPESERVQAEVYIQGYLRGLAMGIERLGASAELWDPGSDYYYTGYGSVISSQKEALADWPEFRGPQGCGTAADKGLPLTWNGAASSTDKAVGENIIWKQALPGPGASSPITWGGKVFISCYSGYGVSTDQPGEIKDLKRHLLCLDAATGKILWDRSQPAAQPEREYKGDLTRHGYASSTPVTDGQAVYVFFGRSGVFAYDLAGGSLWHASVGEGTNEWGSGASPILYENLLIVNASVEGSRLVALDKTSGNEVWRQRATGSWSTPAVVRLPGNRQELVISLRGKVLGLNPATGEKFWEFVAADLLGLVCAKVVVHDDVLYLGYGDRRILAIRAGGTGDVTHSHLLWRINKGSQAATPLYYNGLLYCLDDRGIALCVSAADGKLLYEERLKIPGQGAKVYASLVMADDKLYAMTRAGGTLVLAPGEKFKELARNDLGDSSIFNATPAVWEGKLLLRSDKFLYCIGNH